MSRKQHTKQDQGSFYGDYLYQQLVPQDHFFRILNQLIDWERFTKKLIELYQGGEEHGRPPYKPAVVLKMLFISYLYNLSERRTEIFVNESIPAKYFIGMAIDKPAPDHSTLTYFKKRISQKGNLAVFEDMLAEIAQMAMKSGIQFGRIQIIDSAQIETHVKASNDKQHIQKG